MDSAVKILQTENHEKDHENFSDIGRDARVGRGCDSELPACATTKRSG